MLAAAKTTACTVLGVAVVTSLQGCSLSSRARRVEDVKVHYTEERPARAPAPPHLARAIPTPEVRKTQPAESQGKVQKLQPPESHRTTAPHEVPHKDTGPECPGFSFESPYGIVSVSASRAGELPKVVCPDRHDYTGPQIQCSWVDQLCQVRSLNDTVTPELCTLEYNLTRVGMGLTAWPRGVAPKLVLSKRKGEYLRHERNVSALPVVVTKEGIVCRGEPFVDFDFQHSEVKSTYPPFTQDLPWYKIYKGITSLDGVKVDMRVTQVGDTGSPGNAWMDGNSTAYGRINIDRPAASSLRFEFLEHGTLNPVVLYKFFFTVFDLDDGRDGMHNKQVTAGGMAEYYMSRRTCISVDRTDGDRYMFHGDGVTSQDASSSVIDMWLSSLERTVVFMFRDTSQFTLTVQASPTANGQVLEFAGWSELVDIGTRVQTRVWQGANRASVNGALPEEPVAEVRRILQRSPPHNSTHSVMKS